MRLGYNFRKVSYTSRPDPELSLVESGMSKIAAFFRYTPQLSTRRNGLTSGTRSCLVLAPTPLSSDPENPFQSTPRSAPVHLLNTTSRLFRWSHHTSIVDSPRHFDKTPPTPLPLRSRLPLGAALHLLASKIHQFLLSSPLNQHSPSLTSKNLLTPTTRPKCPPFFNFFLRTSTPTDHHTCSPTLPVA